MANFNKYFKRKLQMKNYTKHYYNIMLCGVLALCVRHVLMAHNEMQLCLVADYEATQYQFTITFNTSKNE